MVGAGLREGWRIIGVVHQFKNKEEIKMSREKQIERLRDMIHDELENLRCAAQG